MTMNAIILRQVKEMSLICFSVKKPYKFVKKITNFDE